MEMLKKVENLVADSIWQATKWMKRKKSGACWKVPVKSECLFSTALSLYVVEDGRRSRIIDYLLSKEVWRKDHEATIAFITALIENGDNDLAREVIEAYPGDFNELSQNPFFPCHLLDILRKNVYRSVVRRNFYSLWFMLTPRRFWYDKTALLYDFLPKAAIVLLSKRNTRVDRGIEEALVRALNNDGSYSGITWQTIRAAYILRELGNEYYAKKALRWIDNTYNGNGSFRPLIFQDVYDTAWAGLALTGSRQPLDSVIEWLESTKVGPGYPYYSYGYNPDPDDTSLILLLKRLLDQINERDYDSLDFLLKSQNPDGGWGYLPEPALSFSFPFNVAFKYFHSFAPRRLPMISGVYLSTVDMTSRVLITLSYFKDYKGVKKTIRRGVKYLFSLFKIDGRVHGNFRWTDSDIYETSLALTALYRNGIHCNETVLATQWILNQRIENAEDAGHALWALVEGGFMEKALEIAELIVSKQSPDGSWKPSINFFLGTAPYWDSIFSTATPLFALHSYIQCKPHSHV